MITEPTTPPRAPRHPYSARGLSLRVLLLGAMLTSLALTLAGGQPVGASADGRGPASDSAPLGDGGPVPSGQGGPVISEPVTGPATDGAVDRGDGPPGGIAPAVSASPPIVGGGSAGGPPDGWQHYHHWTDPSWPDQGEASAPLPARTAGGHSLDPPYPPATDPPPPAGSTPTPGDPTDPGTPTSGVPTASWPAPDPATTTPPSGGIGTPTGSPGGGRADGGGQPASSDEPRTADRPRRDPVAAGPDGQDLGLGDPVGEPTPTPSSVPTARPAQAGADTADTTPTSGYHHTLIYSGMIGLGLAAIGLTMVGLRRRRW